MPEVACIHMIHMARLITASPHLSLTHTASSQGCTIPCSVRQLAAGRPYRSVAAEARARRGAPTMSCSLNTVQYCQG